MKKLTIVWAILALGSAFAALTKVPLEHAEITVDGQKASLYIEGYLPNTCYGEPRAEVLRKDDVTRVYVLSNVEGEICAEVVRLFDLSIDLGEFSPGEHMVHLQSGSRWGSTLSFEISK